MTTDEKLIKNNMGLLELAEEDPCLPWAGSPLCDGPSRTASGRANLGMDFHFPRPSGILNLES
jgi:hypothetical protein